MKNLIIDFKKFAVKGNVIDLAVAVIIGGAFAKIVTSLVDDVVMPIVGVLVGGVKFSSLKLKLSGEASLNYGAFIQSVVDFIIIALAIFLMIRLIANLKKKEEIKEEVVKPNRQEELLTEIRDLLKEDKR